MTFFRWNQTGFQALPHPLSFCVDKLLDYKLRGKDWTGTGRVGTNPNDIHTDEILLFLRLPSSFRLENRPVCFVDCYLHWWRTNVCQITTLASLYPQQEKAQRSGRRFSCSTSQQISNGTAFSRCLSRFTLGHLASTKNLVRVWSLCGVLFCPLDHGLSLPVSWISGSRTQGLGPEKKISRFHCLEEHIHTLLLFFMKLKNFF